MTPNWVIPLYPSLQYLELIESMISHPYQKHENITISPLCFQELYIASKSVFLSFWKQEGGWWEGEELFSILVWIMKTLYTWNGINSWLLENVLNIIISIFSWMWKQWKPAVLFNWFLPVSGPSLFISAGNYLLSTFGNGLHSLRLFSFFNMNKFINTKALTQNIWATVLSWDGFQLYLIHV